MHTIDKKQAARLPAVALALWASFAFLVPAFVLTLNVVDVFAFPLGYFMTAQGASLVFVLVGWLSLQRARRRAGPAATES